MIEEKVPSQYEPMFDRCIIRITDAISDMMPIFNELGGQALRIEFGDITVTMQRNERHGD